MVFSCSERLAGTYLVPHPWLTMPSWPTVERIPRSGLTALAAPPDFLALDKVATVIQEHYAQVLWVRLQAADADPGALLITKIDTAARLDAEPSPGIAEDVARHARHGEWQVGLRLLAEWLVTATIPPAVLVVEGAEHLEAGSPANLDMLVSAFLPHLQGDLDVLLIGFTEWDPWRLEPHGQVLGRSRLQLDRRAVTLLAEAFMPGLSAAVLDQAFALTHGAPGALQAAFSAGAVLGPGDFCAAMAGAGNAQDLLSALGRRLLERSDRHTLISLASARRLGVWHPAMARALGVSTVHRNEPWWLDLAEAWQQLNPTWRGPLRFAVSTRDIDPASLTLLAEYVSSQGAGDRALELYMEAKEIGRAADTAVNVASDLASTGSWATKPGWVSLWPATARPPDPLPDHVTLLGTPPRGGVAGSSGSFADHPAGPGVHPRSNPFCPPTLTLPGLHLPLRHHPPWPRPAGWSLCRRLLWYVRPCIRQRMTLPPTCLVNCVLPFTIARSRSGHRDEAALCLSIFSLTITARCGGTG